MGRRSVWLEYDEQLGISGGRGQSSVQGTAQRPLEAREKDGVGTGFYCKCNKKPLERFKQCCNMGEY